MARVSAHRSQGIKVLGTPVGHDGYVCRLLEKVHAKQQVLLDAIPKVPDVQSVWLLLLHCASARANYQGWSSRLQSLTIKVWFWRSDPTPEKKVDFGTYFSLIFFFFVFLFFPP